MNLLHMEIQKVVIKVSVLIFSIELQKGLILRYKLLSLKQTNIVNWYHMKKMRMAQSLINGLVR